MRDIIENKEIKVNEKNIIPLAEIKEESDVTLNLELYKNNIPFDVTSQSIKLGVLINNELIGEQTDGITINKNVVTIKLKNSFIQPGKLELDLTLTDNTGRMTTSSFYLIVNKKTIGGTSIQGTDLLETLDKVVLYFKVNSQKAIDGFVAESTELLSDIKKNGEKTISDIKSNYDSLKQIIIDENQAANLQEQINVNKNRIEQLEDLTPVWQEHEGIGHVTINDSFAGITKDLVVKGRTLKNLASKSDFELGILSWSTGQVATNNSFKRSSDFIAINGEKVISNIPIHIFEYDNDKIFINSNPNSKKTELALNSNTRFIKICLDIANGDLSTLDLMLIVDNDLPSTYFDSITSTGELEDNKIKIKSVGKNLVKEVLFPKGINTTTGNIDNGSTNVVDFIKVKPNTQYVFSRDGVNRAVNKFYYKKDKSFIKRSDDTSYSFIVPDDCYYVRLTFGNTLEEKIQLEEGSVATNYEQFRSKVIEIPLPFAKGLKSTLDGTIYDEINISKGEIVQRVSEEYTELPKENIYKIPKDYLSFFNGTTNVLQENNITSILKFEYPLNKDASIVSGLLINDILESEIKNNNNNISELNTKLTENKNDIDYLDSKITTSTNNITTLNSKVTTNTNSINNLKTELAKHNIQTNPLWEGASFLANEQELTLNKSLDNCRNGVVLVWSQYNTSTNAAINERFAFVFIRKNTIVQNLNKSFGCLIANASDRVSSYDHIITKYVNVSGTRVVGWRGNNQYQNAQSVLRAVYEW